ncbi:WbqC family protein [Sedimenticola hydrogenitrophicus]|uniref:WbqC family protein n=1 Tax=Sedimenticola hydrogenitrophicus TaxID=2967975 RepID=UPI0021A4485E|nr:WbqC family protein [Sedimenticola hydrogenitrophicus]
MRVVAIHQPNFFPWLGYFDKVRRSDVFILLDDVQYQKTGGTWSNRVKVLVNGEGRWLTAPVDRSFHGTRAIHEMVFSSKENWRNKVLNTLISAYRGAPCFDKVFTVIEPLVRNPEDNVAEYNIHAIKTLTDKIGLTTNSLIRSSDFPVDSSSTLRLIELTKRVGGQSYLCGGGATGYQQDAAFEKENVQLIYQRFIHPHYAQFSQKDFVAGLSIVDALMNVGFEGVHQLMRRYAG